jgi:toxin ParE1/3/4
VSNPYTVRYLDIVEKDLAAIYEFHDDPLKNNAGLKMLLEIDRLLSRLESFPSSGRIGRVNGTRELVLIGTPYIAVYRIEGDQVIVLAVKHAAQEWPKSF